jgi:exo-beta-1,3-glucanase (GH17 family)
MRFPRLVVLVSLIGFLVAGGGTIRPTPAVAQAPSADLDGNGCVDLNDQRLLIAALIQVSAPGSEQSPQNPAYDLDEDGQITVNDSVELARRYTNADGAPCSTPQPEGSRWPFSALVGVNYSRAYAGNPLPVSQAMQQIKQHFGAVKLFGFDPNQSEALTAAQQNGLEVALGTLNSAVVDFQSPAAAQAYVDNTIVPHKDAIKLVILGNELFLSNQYNGLLTALINLKQALVRAGLGSIPVTIAESFGTIMNTYPPACGEFKGQDTSTIAAVLNYLGSINSFVLVNVYPYQAARDNSAISLSYALGTQGQPVPPGCGMPGGTEPSLFRAQLDAFKAAVARLNLVTPPPVYIGETGWASGGGPALATATNEGIYVNTSIRYAVDNGIPSFLFEMYDEDRKCSNCDENFYGLFTADGTPKFPLTPPGP